MSIGNYPSVRIETRSEEEIVEDLVAESEGEIAHKKKPIKRFHTEEDRAKGARQKRNYNANKALRAEYNRTIGSGGRWTGEEPPSGRNKHGSANVKTLGKKNGGAQRHRSPQNYESRP